MTTRHVIPAEAGISARICTDYAAPVPPETPAFAGVTVG